MTDFPKLETGAKAPDFTLLNHDGKPISLAAFKGQKVILYFYPAAITPACSKEARDFNDARKTYAAAGYQIIGVSPDEPKKLAKFADKEDLKFTLLSDPDKKVHQAYGAYGEKSLYGRLYTGVLRSTIIIDEAGMITLPLYNVKATGHVAMLAKRLGIEL